MPTIKDVAKASGVSTATVSYVLNGKRALPADTCERVMKTVQELGYQPSALARGLNHKRLNTLGLLFGVADASTVVTDPYASAVLQGIMRASAAAGYNVTVFTQEWVSAAQSARPYLDGRTDGILVVAPLTNSDMLSGLARLGLPLVAISADGRADGIPCIDVDHDAGIRQAVRHLQEQGHRRIGWIGGPNELYSGIVRTRAFRAALSESGLSLLPEYQDTSSYSGQETQAQARRMLTLPTPPTAILAANDAIALGVLAAARSQNVAVPQQLSVIGFDDSPASRVVHPALTTVHQPSADIGAEATRLLIRCIAGEVLPSTLTLLKPMLLVRETTAAASRENS